VSATERTAPDRPKAAAAMVVSTGFVKTAQAIRRVLLLVAAHAMAIIVSATDRTALSPQRPDVAMDA